MATKSMAYDHPAYTVPQTFGLGVNTAGASWKQGRFASPLALTPKALNVTVVTAGTGTGNCTVTLVKIASGGTAITTHSPTVTMSTNAAGYTTNILCTGGNFAQGDDVYVQGGADATAVFTMSLECVVVPGANLTA